MALKLDSTIVDRVGGAIYAIRWGLVPMYLGLWLPIIGYCIHYFQEIFSFTFAVEGYYPIFRLHDSSEWLLFILNLIDITMIGNLVVMTTIGGYSTFVKEFKIQSLENKPRWMNGLDSTTLKIKMSMSLAGVSAVHLLKTFIDISDRPGADYESIFFQILIHMVFLISFLCFALYSKYLHPHTSHPAPDHSATQPSHEAAPSAAGAHHAHV